MIPTSAPILAPTPLRTATGIGVMLASSTLLLVTAVSRGTLAQTVMIACAVGTVALALAMWRGRGESLTWTADGLTDGRGRIIVARGAIARVDRNALALKPSNGFTLHLHRRQTRAWQPGLYWCIGTRAGIGGLTPPGVAKALADRIALDTAPGPD